MEPDLVLDLQLSIGTLFLKVCETLIKNFVASLFFSVIFSYKINYI